MQERHKVKPTLGSNCYLNFIATGAAAGMQRKPTSVGPFQFDTILWMTKVRPPQAVQTFGLRRHRALLLGILVGVPLSSFAETLPPAAPFDAITWKATMKRKPSTALRMATFHVRFERTTLDDVRRAVSVGEISHHGDAGESAYWLCYTNLAPTRTERIWVIAHGEMGGPEHYVTNISAELLPSGSPAADCPALPNAMKPLSLDNHLWLGASDVAAHAKLGAPSHQEGAWKSYDFRGKVPGNCEGGSFDLSSWQFLHFQNGRVNSLQVGQVTSC